MGTDGRSQIPNYEQPTDWSTARGLWMLDYNCFILLVRASVEEVARAIAADADTWDRDVLGREVVFQSNSAFIFRLRGHSWSVIVAPMYARHPYGCKDHAWEKSLSLRLHRPVMTYGISDTCGSIGYSLVEDGGVVEDFFGEYGEEGRFSQQSFFRSTRRDLGLDQIDDQIAFVWRFMVEQDAFDPGIEFDHFFGRDLPNLGEPAMVQQPVFEWTNHPGGKASTAVPEIERVDRLVFK